MNSWMFSVVCFGLLFPFPFEAGAQSNPTAVAAGELPFRLSSGYLIEVQGRIGVQSNLRFILDTGATITIVDQKIAEKLSLDHHPAQSFNIDRKLKWESATLPELQFGPIHATNTEVFIGRLAEYSEFARDADAIIGMDLLKFSNLSIDFDKHKITFHPSLQNISLAAEDPILRCPILKVEVQGHLLHLIVDTGLTGIVIYEERLRKKVPGLRTTGHPAELTMGGRVKAKQTTIPDVLLGKMNRDIPVLLVASPVPQILPGVEGIIGIDALKAHHIDFDFEARTLRWD
jgi:predicted aspartyl protease